MGVLTDRRIVGVDGVELHVRSWDGDYLRPAPPVLLVHGLASNAAMWDGVASQLVALGHPVAALDQRGHGRSDKPDDGYDFATITGDLRAVLDSLGWARPIVAGQSWGGNVVVELAARHSDSLAGIVCVDGGWIELSQRFVTWDACAEAMAPPFLVGTPATAFRARLRAAHPDWPEDSIDGFMGGFELRDDATVAPWLTRDRHMRILQELWQHHPSLAYSAVTMPALLVPALAADQSPASAGFGASAAAAATALPMARLCGIVGDHDLHAHHPVELAQLMHSWIAEEVSS